MQSVGAGLAVCHQSEKKITVSQYLLCFLKLNSRAGREKRKSAKLENWIYRWVLRIPQLKLFLSRKKPDVTY